MSRPEDPKKTGVISIVSNEDYLRSGQIDWEVCGVRWPVTGRGVIEEGIREMSQFATRITLSANGLIMKIVGDVLIIETSDPDELRREVSRALGDEPLTVQGAAGYLKVSTRTIRNWIKDGKLAAKQFNGAGYRIQKRDLEQIQTDMFSQSIQGKNGQTTSAANPSERASGKVASISGERFQTSVDLRRSA